MDNTLISVIITAYNRKEYLLDAIKSVLGQTLNKTLYEIIVIKNFKNEIIDKFIENNNIKNILMDGTVGEFLYAGIMESKGDIISFLDDDDLFVSNKLEYVYNLFKNNNNLVYFHNNTFYIDSNNKKFKKIQNNSIDFNISCISIRKDIINKNLLKEIWTAPDTLIYLFSLRSNRKIVNSNIRLNFYRIHEENISNNLKWFKEYREQLKNFYSVFTNKKERHLLKYHILMVNIVINLNENKKLQTKYFVYYLIFLFITLHKSLFILMIKNKFRDLYR